MGFLVGLMIATTGAWKDTLFEDFDPIKFWRSPILTEMWYQILKHYYKGKTPPPLLALSAAALERLTTETWKALQRKPPGKFKRENKDRGWLVERLTDRPTAFRLYRLPALDRSNRKTWPLHISF